MTYTIGTLSKLTGLSKHTIRAWERRYGALLPDRSATNRRIYGDNDVQRLNLLKRTVDSGHSIGLVAHLTNEQLHSLRTEKSPVVDGLQHEGPLRFLNLCKDALARLDPEAFEESLVRGTAALGIIGLIEGVVVPLLSDIESRWLDGSLRISEEHLSTATLRTYLDRVRVSMHASPGSPRLLLTTPRNQHHELGCLMVAIIATTESWRVTYLGPNLPATEIAHSARQSDCQAIALSLVYPTDDPELPSALRAIRKDVHPQMPIIVGGRATPYYADALKEINATVCPDLTTFRDALHRI